MRDKSSILGGLRIDRELFLFGYKVPLNSYKQRQEDFLTTLVGFLRGHW